MSIQASELRLRPPWVERFVPHPRFATELFFLMPAIAQRLVLQMKDKDKDKGHGQIVDELGRRRMQQRYHHAIT